MMKVVVGGGVPKRGLQVDLGYSIPFTVISGLRNDLDEMTYDAYINRPSPLWSEKS